MKSYRKNKEGFTLLEMMVVVAIVGIIAVISISNIIFWLPGYRLKSAARDIYSNFQLAKLGAMRENKNWAVVFDVTANPGRYFVCSDNNGDGWNGPPVIGGNDNLEKTVNLSDYKSGVNYGHGNATNAVGGTFGDEITFNNNVVVFNPRGLSNAGYIYLENKNKKGTCAVGCLSSGVIIKVQKGFTLIEILIALFISSVAIISVYSACISQQKSYWVQEQVSAMQQNLRAAMFYMGREIRMAGYDPIGSGVFGITSVSIEDENQQKDINGNGTIQFTADFDNDGVITPNTENRKYCLYDYPTANPDGDLDLARKIFNRQCVAEKIDALGLAFAFDNDEDDTLDTYNVGGNPTVIWAIDSDGDGDLDTNLDTDGDGDIGAADGPGVGGNGTIGGSALTSDIPLNSIRAVRIWLLARTKLQDRDYFNKQTYTVGHRVITPNDRFRRRLLESQLKCRNMGL